MIPCELLKAEDGAEMERKVVRKLKDGWDLYGPLVTAHKFYLGQWMAQTGAAHDYRLVEAKNFIELEQSVLSLQADGFDFFHFTQNWNSVMFQWMCRPTEDGAWVSASMIERVEPTLRLVPNILAGAPPLVVADGHVVEFSSRFHRSTV